MINKLTGERMKTLLAAVALTQVLVSSFAFANPPPTDKALFAGFVRGNQYVGINNEGTVKILPIAADGLSRKDADELVSCEFREMGGEKVAFWVRVTDKGYTDAKCAEAPANNYRKAWNMYLTMQGVK